jgi:aminoglycoside/choline kinase family phosphotransferase
MRTRSDSIDEFLARSGWQEAQRTTLAADASFRRYERVFKDGRRAVLMDAPPGKEDIRPFIHVGEYLLNAGLSAPAIYARDTASGLLLLEDLGDDLFTRQLRQSPQKEEALYLAGADVLVALYRHAERADYNGFLAYDAPLLMFEANLFAEWFMPAVMGKQEASKHIRKYKAIWQELLEKLPALRRLLVLRDYHADNLLWLPEREGVKRVGLLDFQDGVIGSPAYDMVSFLEDARRDVQPDTVRRVLAAYLEHTCIPKEDFMAAYALLGAQRNCKIVGIFTRLAVRDGKRQYLSYLPRVWDHLARDLQHPLLKPLKAWMDEVVRPEWRGVINANAGDGTQATA